MVDYGLNLFSAPSGFVNGLAGDQHEQADQRVLWGGGWQHSWFLGEGAGATELTLGTLLRQWERGVEGEMGERESGEGA